MEHTTLGAQEPARAYTEFAGKAVETMGLWADASQRMLRELVELGTGTAKEGTQLCADLQRTALEAMRESQGTALRWQTSWEAGLKEPVRWYQHALLESVEGTEKAFRMFEANTKAWSRSAERIQGSAEQSGKSIQEICKDVVTRVKDVYSKS